MPESPSQSLENLSPGGSMPSYEQGAQSLDEPFGVGAPMAGISSPVPNPYQGYYPYIPQPPFVTPYQLHGTIDLSNWYGPIQQIPYNPYFSGMAPMYPGTAMAPTYMQPQPPTMPTEAYSQMAQETPSPTTPSPIEKIDVPDPSVQPSKEAQTATTQPSVQVVVQPSQPLPPVQVQQTGQSAPLPSTALTPQSQMATNIMQPVPQTGQQFASGPLYPQMSSPFLSQPSNPLTLGDDLTICDPDLATGGRVAGATFLGILSIPFSLFAPIGFLFSLVGLHLANSYINNGGGRGVGNLARFFCVIGLILTIVVTAVVALYVGYSAGQDGFTLFGEDPIAYINNSEPMQFLLEQWDRLMELWPWGATPEQPQ